MYAKINLLIIVNIMSLHELNYWTIQHLIESVDNSV